MKNKEYYNGIISAKNEMLEGTCADDVYVLMVSNNTTFEEACTLWMKDQLWFYRNKQHRSFNWMIGYVAAYATAIIYETNRYWQLMIPATKDCFENIRYATRVVRSRTHNFSMDHIDEDDII
jgi:hypothetical protein